MLLDLSPAGIYSAYLSILRTCVWTVIYNYTETDGNIFVSFSRIINDNNFQPSYSSDEEEEEAEIIE